MCAGRKRWMLSPPSRLFHCSSASSVLLAGDSVDRLQYKSSHSSPGYVEIRVKLPMAFLFFIIVEQVKAPNIP
ncbi:hypothetical protein N9P82_00140 [bacterium]|nr:hypothetical protein [bacterium]